MTISPTVDRDRLATLLQRELETFAERTGADELMLTSQIFDHRARLRSFEIVARGIGKERAEKRGVPEDTPSFLGQDT